ncbi:response regulator [Novosphingobium sp.]|uniref:response regulator n=1 Tax=Novosphingobium sp. TaxID=1874826 RepID=UPI00286B95B9|nr:response regulator [Novosphingobium sp.]
MASSQAIKDNLPYLRRFARSLTGTQKSGDGYVRMLLEAAQSDRDLVAQMASGRVGLYSAFCKLHRSGAAAALGVSREVPQQRQALLLTTMEDFSATQAGEILGLSADDVELQVAEALAVIDGENPARVLIIEDEPLISMQLEGLVEDLGHAVCGMAATRDQAVALAAEQAPSLVLADIQLADGSSGIDAVDDIMRGASVPVVFITAYPERLLTGERSEPAFLVTKPFHEATVRAAISQALFFAD